MKIEMGKYKHLWIVMGDQSTTNQAEVIIDLEHLDIRINDFQSVVKVRLTPTLKVKDILRNDIFQTDVKPRQP